MHTYLYKTHFFSFYTSTDCTTDKKLVVLVTLWPEVLSYTLGRAQDFWPDLQPSRNDVSCLVEIFLNQLCHVYTGVGMKHLCCASLSDTVSVSVCVSLCSHSLAYLCSRMTVLHWQRLETIRKFWKVHTISRGHWRCSLFLEDRKAFSRRLSLLISSS